MTKLDALKAIADGINALVEMEENNTIASSKLQKPAEKVESAEVAEQENDVDVDSMDYRQLKAYAAQIGVKATGTKGQLVKAVKGFLANDEASDAEDDSEEEKPAPKRGAKALKPKNQEEEPDEEDEVEEEVNSTIAEVEKAIAEQELTDDDLRDILKDLGVSTKGSHEVLVSKLADAVDAGELSLDGDEEDSGESDENDENDEEDSADESDEEYTITPERRDALKKFVEETREAFDNEELSVDDMREFIKDFGEKISKKASDEEVLDKYIECASSLIDDEGNTVEEGAYMLNGEPFCCGHALEVSEDGTTGKCSVCGEEYEFEE